MNRISIPTKLDHCVIHVSDWERANAFYTTVLGAKLVTRPTGYAYRFGDKQLNVHGPGVRPAEIARIPVAPGNSDLCFEWAGPITEAKALQLEFWTSFRETLLEKKIVVSAHTPRPQYWFDVSLGRSNIHLSNIANTSDGRIGVRVYIGNKISDAALPQLEAERVAIEKEIGEPLQWNPNPDNKDKIILLDRAADLNNRDKWPEYVAWLAERVAQFKRAFEPRIKKLDLSQAQGAEPQA